MQASSDIFLGWQRVDGVDGVQRDYYIRQLQDWKGSIDTDNAIPEGMRVYAALCARTLARAHARSSDRIAIAAYLGSNATFDKALVSFRRDLRRPERAGLRGLRPGVPQRPPPRRRGAVTSRP